MRDGVRVTSGIIVYARHRVSLRTHSFTLVFAYRAMALRYSPGMIVKAGWKASSWAGSGGQAVCRRAAGRQYLSAAEGDKCQKNIKTADAHVAR